MPQLSRPDGAEIFFADEGTGPLALLVHGGTGTGAYDWEFVRPELARTHRVITMDLRGHGRSSDPEWLLGPDQVGDDVLALIDLLGERPAVIVAFSVGATSMLGLLARRPDIADAAVVIGASIEAQPERIPEILSGPWPRDLIALDHEHGEGPEHWRRLRERLSQTLKQSLSPEQLAAIDIPMLVVNGDRDVIEPVETALAIARALPQGELLVLPGVGHFVQRRRPEELLVALTRFLDRHAAVSG